MVTIVVRTALIVVLAVALGAAWVNGILSVLILMLWLQEACSQRG